MKRIVTNIAVVTDAEKPTITQRMVFDDFNVDSFSVKNEEANWSFMASRVLQELDETDPENIIPEQLEQVKRHTKYMTKAEMNTLFSALTIDATDFYERSEEEIIKGAIELIYAAESYGLTRDDLIIE